MIVSSAVLRRCRWLFSGSLVLLPWAVAAHDFPALTAGQSVYVPVYSSVFHGNIGADGKPSELLLSSMLSVRNTDPKYSLVITSVKYYDTTGQSLREYITTPKVLPPMASTDYFVEYRERFGGTGANFVVQWKADQPINQPILETVQVYNWGSLSKAFISRGQVIHLHENEREP
ncbi:MAG: DUF3124 domain-containing protein [Magnetococcus sp. XQGC-1]